MLQESFFKPSLHLIKKYSKLLNEELFNNKLIPIDYIDIRRRRGCWAEYSVLKTGKTLLCMNHRYHSKEQFIDILAHELIHHWQFINNFPLGHGNTFKYWKPKFKKKGLTLKRGY